ncbi:MAG: hypothetical protein QHH19_06845 [Candidatus Thermoplasmatota archaeon]|jgi:hypothetical protein|nr:hypothetical protein [Candidatus Thermoplasmatota archaeon]
MNKTLIALGVGIWVIMLILNFILRGSLGAQLNCDEIAATLLPLTIIEIVACIITIVGIFKND